MILSFCPNCYKEVDVLKCCTRDVLKESCLSCGNNTIIPSGRRGNHGLQSEMISENGEKREEKGEKDEENKEEHKEETELKINNSGKKKKAEGS